MYIIYSLNGEVITVCSSERTLNLAEKDLVEGQYEVSYWRDCPSEIIDYLARR